MPGDSEIEIRPVFEAEHFGAEFTPGLPAQEQRLRTQIEGRGKTGKSTRARHPNPRRHTQ